MFKNYLKIAWRNLVKHKAHTFINIAGLSVGLTCSLLILLWVQSELSVDAYHVNNNRLYQVYEREYLDHKVTADYNTQALMAGELKKLLPEVQYAASMQESNDQHTFSAGKQKIKLEGTFAGADLFKMFSYPLLQGTPQTALNSPLSIAISKKMAVMFFGGAVQAMGKTIRFDNRKDLSVSAVFADLPQNTSRKFEYIINWDIYLADHPGAKNWGNTEPSTFVMLKGNADPELFRAKLKKLFSHYRVETNQFRAENDMQRFDEVYLHNNFINGELSGGRVQYVNLFSIVAVFILLIACVNFMNLTTAQSVKRAHEIGVRKVMGAARGLLIKQFIGESLMLTLAAVTVSFVLMTLCLPLFNNITHKQMHIPFREASFWLKIILITLITGFVAGSYPALFLSSFKPIGVLKGTLKVDAKAVWFRKGLVVFQFVISAVLIVSTIIMSRQVNFIQHTNLGYDRENLIYIPIEGDLSREFNAFKNEALSMPGIQSVSNISASPTFINDGTTSVDWDGKEPGTTVSFSIAAIGYDFASTMKMQVQGRDFSKDLPTDANNYIINEAARQKMGYRDAIGKSINMWGVKGKIIGLVKDFHFASLHDEVTPLILRLQNGNINGSNLLIRTKAGQTKEALASLQKIYKDLNPEFPLTYHFSDEQFQKLYQSEQVAGTLSYVFAFLAIFISCIGLLGLAMFTAEQRLKEIGIRKVLGATVGTLFALLSSEFLALVVIALLIASPLAWYAMNNWLRSYAYHTDMHWWMFAFSGGLILFIALATVSFQALRAALVNPVKSLRSE